MESKDWKRLAEIGADGSEESERLFALTELEAEHPEDYEGPCCCQYCKECAQ